jgi:hypothetical protein
VHVYELGRGATPKTCLIEVGECEMAVSTMEMQEAGGRMRLAAA